MWALCLVGCWCSATSGSGVECRSLLETSQPSLWEKSWGWRLWRPPAAPLEPPLPHSRLQGFPSPSPHFRLCLRCLPSVLWVLSVPSAEASDLGLPHFPGWGYWGLPQSAAGLWVMAPEQLESAESWNSRAWAVSHGVPGAELHGLLSSHHTITEGFDKVGVEEPHKAQLGSPDFQWLSDTRPTYGPTKSHRLLCNMVQRKDLQTWGALQTFAKPDAFICI